MIKPRWITTECECILRRKNGRLVLINIYLVNNSKWRVVSAQMPEIDFYYNSITEAKKAAIANFERIEAQNE